ncbi:holo-ACP synthase [Akkermansiaceae bacterium]|nr:holo-ACP synthase [Akkermansiaceae bacterium]
MIGIDIESIERIESLYEKKPNIIKRFFSEYELQYAEKKAKTCQTLTGIWCAKEAVVKAYSNVKPILVTDVKVKHDCNGKPYVSSISNRRIMSKLKISISISHSKDYATAVARIDVT